VSTATGDPRERAMHLVGEIGRTGGGPYSPADRIAAAQVMATVYMGDQVAKLAAALDTLHVEAPLLAIAEALGVDRG
jgi:hypothetical protein